MIGKKVLSCEKVLLQSPLFFPIFSEKITCKISNLGELFRSKQQSLILRADISWKNRRRVGICNIRVRQVFEKVVRCP